MLVVVKFKLCLQRSQNAGFFKVPRQEQHELEESRKFITATHRGRQGKCFMLGNSEESHIWFKKVFHKPQ